jgi:DNA-binding CsgD family transcriptional regulator
MIEPSIGSNLEFARVCLGADERVLETILPSAAFATGDAKEVYAYSWKPGGAPEMLVSASLSGSSASDRAKLHSTRYWHFDPFLKAAAEASSTDMLGVKVAATDIDIPDYRRTCFEIAGFRDKLCFAWNRTDTLIGLNFYVSRTPDDEATRRLAALASAALLALSRNLDRRLALAQPLLVRVDTALQAQWPELTTRERQVMARTLVGWSVPRIAAALGIGTASVVTYRQRACRRCDVDHAGQLLDRLIG